MAQIHTISGKLRVSGVNLPPIPLNMFIIKDLLGAYVGMKKEFALKSGL